MEITKAKLEQSDIFFLQIWQSKKANVYIITANSSRSMECPNLDILMDATENVARVLSRVIGHL